MKKILAFLFVLVAFSFFVILSTFGMVHAADYYSTSIVTPPRAIFFHAGDIRVFIDINASTDSFRIEGGSITKCLYALIDISSGTHYGDGSNLTGIVAFTNQGWEEYFSKENYNVKLTTSLYLGADASGIDFVAYGDTAGTKLFWDASLHALTVGNNNEVNGLASIAFGRNNSLANPGWATSYSSILGGMNNICVDGYATIAGGWGNTIESSGGSNYSFVGAGYNNTISTDATTSAIVGGYNNNVSSATGFIGGGHDNEIHHHQGTIAGGDNNQIWGDDCFIGGGSNNTILGSGDLRSVIVGGYYNSTDGNAQKCFIGGGSYNEILEGADWGTISGGNYNEILSNGSADTISGGAYNVINTALYSTIGGGNYNFTNASWATIPGGRLVKVYAEYATAFGAYSVAKGTGSVVGGYGTAITANNHPQADGKGSVALGYKARVLGTGSSGSVALGYGVVDSAENAFCFGKVTNSIANSFRVGVDVYLTSATTVAEITLSTINVPSGTDYVYISSDVYGVGFSSFTTYYGDGSNLTGIISGGASSLQVKVDGSETSSPTASINLINFFIGTESPAGQANINISTPALSAYLLSTASATATYQPLDADLTDLADGTLSKSKVEDSGNWDSAYTHISNDGGDHSYIDQSVVSGGTPTFSANNFSDGGSNAIITTTQETNFESAYTHVSNDGSDHSYIDQDVTASSTPTFSSMTVTYGISGGSLTVTANISGGTYASDSSVSDAELKYINTLGSNAQTQIDGKEATVTEGSLADSVITSADILNNTITNDDMADNSIDSADYVDGSIDREHLAGDIDPGTDSLTVYTTPYALTTGEGYPASPIRNYAVTITSMTGWASGGGSVVWMIEQRALLSIDSAGTDMFTGDITSDNTWRGGTFSDATIPVDYGLVLVITSVTGDVRDFKLKYRFTVD